MVTTPVGPTRALRAKPDLYTPLVVRQLGKIEADLGGRASLVGMLVLAPLTPDLRYVLGLLGNPDYEHSSLAEICAAGHILPGDLLKHLARAALQVGQVRAAKAAGDGIAAVVEDVMRKAAPYTAKCHACRGVGMITPEPTPQAPNPSPEQCETCLGVGELEYQPSLEVQKVAIDLAQLLPKAAGIQIGLQQNNGGTAGGSGGGLFDRLQAATDRILYAVPARPPSDVEGEVIEGEGDAG